MAEPNDLDHLDKSPARRMSPRVGARAGKRQRPPPWACLKRTMCRRAGGFRTVTVTVLALVAVLLTSTTSFAQPTASFTSTPTSPMTNEPVTFTFTGTCDVPPCRVQWRWFQAGGSSLGTSMGEGEQIAYAFASAGSYSVVVRITNSLSTHGSATATQGILVADPPPPPPPLPPPPPPPPPPLPPELPPPPPPPPPPLQATFTSSQDSPSVNEPVTFTFTGTCDVPPCRVQWRWLQAGDSSLGTSMGEGEQIDYAFSSVGSYSVVVHVTNAAATPDDATATRAVLVVELVEDQDLRVRWDRWQGREMADAAEGGYRIGHGTATFRFSGTRVTYVAITGPGLGIARVTVDGQKERAVDLYSPAIAQRRWSFPLATGTHRIVVTSTGGRNPASTGTAVSLDEIVVNGVHHDDTDRLLSYGSWAGRSATGTSHASSRKDAQVGLTFSGTALTWVTTTGPDQGLARVEIDGATVAIVNNWATSIQRRVLRTFTGLSQETHRVRIVVLGRHRQVSTASEIVVDAFVVR